MARLAKVYSAELEGIAAKLIEVEVDLNVGLHSFNIVGLADKSLNEARERVNSALKNSGFKSPNRDNRRITVNLAPADIKKTGSQYDLAIALGYLLASGQVSKFDSAGKIFLGELSLDGVLRPVSGALNVAQMAAEKNFKYLLLPEENALEAAVIKDLKIIPIKNLKDAVEYLEERIFIEPARFEPPDFENFEGVDFSEIKGQENAKRAMAIAAAGGHNLLMVGSPGVGKSLLAQALISILAPLTLEESIEITKIYSAAGVQNQGLITKRPYRAPHQTSSPVALVGGGSNPKPGEISLAHRGILFLDELPEFRRDLLEALRQPLEAGFVQITRVKGSLKFPAKFTLVAAINPCPCGYYGDPEHKCTCSAYDVIRYQKKISGPLLDRIDLQIRVDRVKVSELRKNKKTESESDKLRKKVKIAREIQTQRFKSLKIKTNSEMSSKQCEEIINFDSEAEKFLETLDKSWLSPRGYYRLLKTA
ncbi:YifB family Mg chelatase-like AAA ATPase, partial [Patescibacteria group bacterium]|nr:YifB family Mg chelatase-like AAA ATPase [Patescibacteria group bacterium]